MLGGTIDDDIAVSITISSSASVCVMFVVIGQFLDNTIHRSWLTDLYSGYVSLPHEALYVRDTVQCIQYRYISRKNDSWLSL
jgi:hypothetical protein